MSHGAHATTLTIEPDQFPAGYGYLAGTFQYTDDSVFPAKATTAEGTYKRTFFEPTKERLLAPDRWAEPDLFSWPAGTARFFEGEDEPLAGFGFRPIDAFDQVVENSPEAASMLASGGCVFEWSFIHSDSASSGVLPEGVLDVDPEAEVQLAIMEGNGAGHVWIVQWGTAITGEKRFGMPQGPFDESGVPEGCEAIRRSPAPSLSLNDVLDQTAPLAVLDDWGAPQIVVRVQNDSWYGRSPEDGWTRYSFLFPSSGASFEPSFPVWYFHATPRQWRFMDLSAAAYQQFDEGQWLDG